MHCFRIFAVFIVEVPRRVASDRLAMAEPDGLEANTRKLVLARTALFQTLEADRITEAHDIDAYIACEQHTSRTL